MTLAKPQVEYRGGGCAQNRYGVSPGRLIPGGPGLRQGRQLGGPEGPNVTGHGRNPWNAFRTDNDPVGVENLDLIARRFHLRLMTLFPLWNFVDFDVTLLQHVVA